MSNSVNFAQGCPTCGRRLYIRVEHLGKKVVCQHCHGKFTACDQSSLGHSHFDASDVVLRRANELLRNATQRNLHSQVGHPR